MDDILNLPGTLVYFNSEITNLFFRNVSEFQDQDYDDIPDNIDNCPLAPNTNQLDGDADEIGNICDSDDDNDNISDIVEIAAGSNPLNLASTPETCDGVDNDLDENTDERFTNTDRDEQADCIDSDDDNDGAPESWEEENNLNPLVIDSHLDPDSDTYVSLLEYFFGTDPRIEILALYLPLFHLMKGFNIISIPETATIKNHTSFSLLAAIGDDTVTSSIQRFNMATGKFETASYRDGEIMGIDFPIIIGNGYNLYLLQSTVFSP